LALVFVAGVAVSLTMILAIDVSFVRSGDVALIDVVPAALVVGAWFSMESLILAQDERWRRA
jgi:hypothetical protein